MSRFLDELDSGHIYEALQVLNSNRSKLLNDLIDDMQPTEVGVWYPGNTVPKFYAVVGTRFVQILNVGDHWITVTNVFGKTTHININMFMTVCIEMSKNPPSCK